MKLYFSKGACSLVPRIIINELNLPCEFIAVDLATKKTQNGDNFYSINAKGSVPALTIDKGETLTENAVILQFLADSTKATALLPPVNQWERYRVLEWLNFITTELHKGFSPLFNAKLSQDVKDQIFIPALKAKLSHVNTHLEKNTYLSGDNFTLPDAYLFVMLTWASHFKFPFQEWTHLSRYFNELLARTSVQKSLEEEGLQVMKV